MRKSYLITIILFFVSLLSFAQAHRDAVPEEEGLNLMSLLIGAVVGLVVGYLIGSRMAKK